MASTIPAINFDFSGDQIIYSEKDRMITDINEKKDVHSSNGYLLVDPINITTGSDWGNYPFITGNGSASNPYIIENVEIIGDGIKTVESGNDTLLDTSDIGIFINTGDSFIIRNSKISHTSIGIQLSFTGSSGPFIIFEVEIHDCSIGIRGGMNRDVNISNCYIHNCNWISIKAKLNLNYFLDYGGIGIWVDADGAIIENCRVEDCSIGMMAEFARKIDNNEFINCGIVPYYPFMYLTAYNSSNTVNGKPIGMFIGIDNLDFTNASLYGQLLFAVCDNLTLSNIHFTEPCSIPIQLFSLGSDQTTYLSNIIIENQKLGLFITGENVIGDNLYVKNCDAGFYFSRVRNSEFTRVMIDNTEVPVYMTPYILNFTIELEVSTKFYLFDGHAWYGDILEISPGDDVTMSYIAELGMEGYTVQFNHFGTYNLNLTIPGHSENLFTVISVPRNVRPDVWAPIRDVPFIWYWTVILLALIVFIEFCRRYYQK